MRPEPVDSAQAGDAAAGETRGQQVAAGRRFPVQHLASAEHAGHRGQHQRWRDCFQAHATRAADRFGHRSRAQQAQRQALDGGGQSRDVVAGIAAEDFVHKRGLDAADARLPPQVFTERTTRARFVQGGFEPLQVAAWREVEVEQGAAVFADRIAQLRR
jgi:hypothetical protein